LKPWINSFFFLLLWSVLACDSQVADAPPKRKIEPTVYVDRSDGGYTLYRNGEPFQIKGASGQPKYLSHLSKAGGNCLRVYDTLGLAQVLDSAQRYGIAIIADLPLPKSQYLGFYRDPELVEAQLNAYRDFVYRHKDHPALLMWMLGNEIDFPYRPKYAPFYRAYNDLLVMIHSVDEHHPVATALTNFQRRTLTNIQLKIPDLDLLGINTFGALTSLEKNIADFAWMWDGPYFVSEWSINGYWEVPKTAWGAPVENAGWKKRQELLSRFHEQMPGDDSRFLGSCMFYWGQKQELTATWFNAFTEDGFPNELYAGYAQLNTDTIEYASAPDVQYMLVEEAGGEGNIMLKPDQMYSAEIVFKSLPDTNLQTHWSLQSEDWYSLDLDTLVPVVHYEHLLNMPGKLRLEFCTPEHEGPYRLFANLRYPGSITTSVNTPFYVIE
jgi:hypothetical protein